MNIKSSIGQRIAAARAALGLSQIELSELTGFGKTRLSNWETGFRTPKLEDAKVLEKHLQQPAPYLLCLTDSPESQTSIDSNKHYFKSVPIFNESDLTNVEQTIQVELYNTQHYLPLPRSQLQLMEQGAFAFELYDNSMAPQLTKHDFVVFKPLEKARHNDIILVKIKATNEILCRHYHLDHTKTDEPLIQLIPNNPQWITTLIENPSELLILGVMSSTQRVFL